MWGSILKACSKWLWSVEVCQGTSIKAITIANYSWGTVGQKFEMDLQFGVQDCKGLCIELAVESKVPMPNSTLLQKQEEGL